MDALRSSTSLKREVFISSLTEMVKDYKIHKAKSIEPDLYVLQTAEKHYVLAADFQTCCFFNKSSQYVETVSGCIAKLV